MNLNHSRLPKIAFFKTFVCEVSIKWRAENQIQNPDAYTGASEKYETTECPEEKLISVYYTNVYNMHESEEFYSILISSFTSPLPCK